MQSRNPKILIFILFIVFLGIGFFYLKISLAPKHDYKISAEINPDVKESPLDITTSLREIKYSIVLNAAGGEYEKINLYSDYYVNIQPPFIHYGNTLTLKLLDQDGKQEKIATTYTITGKISNLEKEEYKLRVIDEHENLLDEKMIRMQTIQK